MKWNDVSKKPKNGEEVLGFRTSSDWGDEYLLCTFFKKGTIIQDDYPVAGNTPENRLLDAIFNPKNKGKKVIQEDCFCFQEVNKDDLLEWRVWRSIQKWARIYNPDGKASIPRNIEILK